MLHGVDVSNHQPNWKPASNDRFVGILCSDGHTWKSPTHDEQVKLTRKSKKRVVLHYHWLRHGNIQAQAAWFVKCANPKAGDVMAIDWEQSGTTNRDKDDMIKAVQKLCPNNRVVVYMNDNFWNLYDKTHAAGDGLWRAEPGASTPKKPWLFWQYKFGTSEPDQDRANFAHVADLVAWSKETPAPAPDPAPTPAVQTVEGIPLGAYKTSGTKITWRPLYHNNNVQATKTCHCVTQALAVAEARLIKAGVIKECLDMWQFGYGAAAAASAGTHSAGGVIDTVQIDATTQKVLREVGFAGAWYRGPGSKYGNFSTKHIHAVLAGCPHVSNDAADQIDGKTADGTKTGVRNGRNGLANNAKDYGPKVPYITWQDAWKKYVTEAPNPAPTPAPIDQEELDVATQAPVRHRSKPQVVKPTKNGDHKILYVQDNGNVSWAFGPGRYEMAAYIRFEGIDANDELLIQAAIVDTEPGTGKILSQRFLCEAGLKGGDGTSFGLYRWRWNVAAPKKGQTRRLRISAQNFTGKNITVTEMYTYNWKAAL